MLNDWSAKRSWLIPHSRKSRVAKAKRQLQQQDQGGDEQELERDRAAATRCFRGHTRDRRGRNDGRLCGIHAAILPDPCEASMKRR